jgi:catechol 2,3-dioxygenase-like lactoylglutathione lyase family enzyme
MKTRIVQLGMCTADLSRTARRYCEGFGFRDAGGHMMWGAGSARIQGLGSDATGAMWWLVGEQRFFNLEFFRHSLPRQRPLPADWLPNTLGWVRWGFATTDFDGAVAYLKKVKIDVSQVVTVGGLRRVCFRDPDIGVVVEVMEEGAALAGSKASRSPGAAPRVLYAALSVSDLSSARTFYADVMEMAPVSEHLHTPEMEALWGLPGAKREVLVLDGAGVFLEIVQYTDPVGRRRPDVLLSDQGIMNIAIGYREREAAERAIARAVAGGCTLNAPLVEGEVAATYVSDPLGNSLELLCVPESLDAAFGWVARQIRLPSSKLAAG